MCSPSENFKLCTCADDPSQLATAEFTWKLYRYPDKTKRPRMIIGKFVFPAEKLAAHLDAEAIAKQMNAGHCFDFEYVPEENDTLQIYTAQNPEQFIRLRYNDGRWWRGRHLFRADAELLHTGWLEKSE